VLVQRCSESSFFESDYSPDPSGIGILILVRFRFATQLWNLLWWKSRPMKTISTTYCKRFDNSCYHHQCIANWTAAIMLQVLIGHSGKMRCEKMKNAKGCFGSDSLESLSLSDSFPLFFESFPFDSMDWVDLTHDWMGGNFIFSLSQN